MRFLTRVVCAAAASLAVLSTGFAQSADTYPDRPIRFMVPYPPGGPTDLVTRIVGEALSESFGQPVVVENRPGASGVVAAEALSRAPADGYTIMLAISTHAINSTLIPTLSYDPDTAFAPVGTMVNSEFALLANPDTGYNTVEDVIKAAKANPGKLNAGLIGSAGIGRMAVELFADQADVQYTQVPYKGSAALFTALAGGEVDIAFDIANSHLSQINAGRIKALAVTGDQRLDALPNVPTFAEAGLPNYDVRMWFGILAPGKTPPEIVNKLSKEVARLLQTDAVKQRLAKLEFSPFISTPEAFDKLIKDDTARFAKIIKDAGIKPQ